MNFNEAIVFLNSLINYERGFEKYGVPKYDPGKVGFLLKKAGLNYDGIKIIHIAGTKGKGSSAYYMAKLIALSSDSIVGLYTSPHIFRINERIKINFKDISDEEFSDIISRYADLLKGNQVTYFEALTFISMVCFIDNKCNYIVLETGLGGRLDSTNFSRPNLSIITPIAFDHTAILGNTLSEIAGEKAGIIKEGIPVITALQPLEAFNRIKEAARSGHSEFYYFPDWVNYQINERSAKGSVFEAAMRLPFGNISLNNIKLSQIGNVFVDNFLLSLFSCFIIGIDLNLEKIKEAALLSIPCRIELRDKFIIDVSHNDSSLRGLFQTLRDYINKERMHLYIGILADKEIKRVANVIEEFHFLFKKITVFDFKAYRKSGGNELFLALKHLKNTEYLSDISDIKTSSDEFNVFTGSFYTVERLVKKALDPV